MTKCITKDIKLIFLISKGLAYRKQTNIDWRVNIQEHFPETAAKNLAM